MSFAEIVTAELEAREEFTPELAADVRRWGLLWRTAWSLREQLQQADADGDYERRAYLQPRLSAALLEFRRFGVESRLLLETVPPDWADDPVDEASAIRELLSLHPNCESHR